MSIYFRSSLGINFPKSPYIGQIHYDPDLKRTFCYKQKDPDRLYFGCIDMFHWVRYNRQRIFLMSEARST